MIINWYGEACFKIQSGETVILTDPFESSTGLNKPRFRTDIILKTTDKESIGSSKENNETIQIVGPGEYEVKNAEILGFNNKNSPIFIIQLENLRVAFLGYLIANLEPTILEKMNEIDILFIPAGGKPFIDQKEAGGLIKKLTPKIVIPCLFKIPGLKRKTSDVKEFLKNLELKAEIQEKLTIKKKDLPNNTKVMILKI